MPTTRKKVIKTVYKDDDSEGETGDFSDSGSEAQISEASSSDEEDVEEHRSSGDEFNSKPNKIRQKPPFKRKPKFAKEFLNKINKQDPDTEDKDANLPLFTVKDLTDADKLLPSVLNLSESDSSDDETTKPSKKKAAPIPYSTPKEPDNDDEDETKGEYTDIWGNNIPDDSEEIAKKTFMELEKHKKSLEETKASIQNYVPRSSIEQIKESNVTDLLALGEDVVPTNIPVKSKRKDKKTRHDSDSELEDWEEVKESKPIPQQGLQLVVALPDGLCRKSKKIDVEMMMKRKMNKVKKEHQVFMHKVHVLCWIGHGNYVSPVLNDQEIMSAVLEMVPKGCYPENRLDMKYVEQITKWYKDKIVIKHDKYENKFRPKAPPLRTILLEQIKNRTVTAKKYMVFIFVAMLRALGLQCRIMFNFVTVPLRPPSSELCSLSMKPKDEGKTGDKNSEKPKAAKRKSTETKAKSKIPQVDGNYDSCLSSDYEFDTSLDADEYLKTDNYYEENDEKFDNIIQVDGNDDAETTKARPLRTTRAKKAEAAKAEAAKVEAAKADDGKEDEGVSPPKLSKKTSEIIIRSVSQTNSVAKKASKSSLKKTDKRTTKSKEEVAKGNDGKEDEEVSPPKRSKKTSELTEKTASQTNSVTKEEPSKSSLNKTDKQTTKGKDNNVGPDNESDGTINSVRSPRTLSLKKPTVNDEKSIVNETTKILKASPRKTRSNSSAVTKASETSTTLKSDKTNTAESKKKISNKNVSKTQIKKKLSPPNIVVTDENQREITESKNFEKVIEDTKRPSRKRSHTTNVDKVNPSTKLESKDVKTNSRAKSAPGSIIVKSKYFIESEGTAKMPKLSVQQKKKIEKLQDAQRVSHKDLIKAKAKPKNDVANDLVNIIKGRIKEAKQEAKKGIVKGKVKEESDDDSDYLPVEDPKRHNSSDEEFKPTKISPKGPKQILKAIAKPRTSKKHIDRRVLSSDEDTTKNNENKVDVWCEIFVEELEQWIAVDVVNGKVHCTGNLYKHATHPVCYVIGWDNNNYLKDLTRRYVPQWNTVTRKQRVEPEWWRTAVQSWLGPRNARDKEEDESLDRMQLDAPLPTSIGEYKNHPLYALKRHLLKFEAIYPPDAQTLGFVRNEGVYARECVYVCCSRDKWLKEAKVVKMGEKPYKVVKARPKWDRLSNKLITDKPLEVFGPWQVQDYEPPTAENGLVPRNAYGNVELFKDCMLPKGTVHVKLPGLNKVCRKLNIDCAPAMTGFDFNGGWSHPVYDGFVVCKEFEEIVTEAWLKDQEEQERKEREKLELRVYGNWKRLIKGLLIRQRLKYKYGFEEPTTSQTAKKKGPRFVAKKN